MWFGGDGSGVGVERVCVLARPGSKGRLKEDIETCQSMGFINS